MPGTASGPSSRARQVPSLRGWASLLIRRMRGAKGARSSQIYLDCAGNLDSQFFLVVGIAAFRDVSETISCLPSSLELGSQEAFVLPC